jgi:Protein of unknown function (DUF3443)
MRNVARMVAVGLIGLSSLAFVSCGGGGGGASAVPTPAAPSNEVAVIVDKGPDPVSNPTANTLYTTVTVCVPGSATCQTIDHIQVDTGSVGLRILGPPVLTLSLPAAQATDGNSLLECTQFVGAYSWGSIASADIQVAGEKASSVPVQVIGSSAFAVPAACANKGTAEDSVAAFGANGILGVGVFAQDCGTFCRDNVANSYYYSCTAAACSEIAAPLSTQVLNPVPLFPVDNNGSIIVLPTVADAGAATVSGSLIFGIDTQSNNASGSETILVLDGSGDFTTTVDSETLSQSFIDSGTNGLFFYDPNLQSSLCTASGFTGFYCPASPQTLTATLTGAGTAPATTTATFTIDNAQTLLTNSPSFAAFATDAGTYSSNTLAFDWGLPFFYGRRVATAIEGKTTTVGTGPYVAF